MSTLAVSFLERKAEVKAYLDFLSVMEQQTKQGPPRFEGAEHPITVEQQRILYSTVYLQLYNLVEATISLCIQEVTDATKNNVACTPNDLNDDLRREWVRAIARTHEPLTPDNRLKHALLLCDHLVSALPINSFDLDKAGGGNWDDSAIELMTKRLGFRLRIGRPIYKAIKRHIRDDMGPLALVKNLRNRLAHGSISFVECSENETFLGLQNLANSTLNYLEAVVGCFDKYIEGHEYLLPDRRP
ncbi:MAE_28990/MAE_18760 family HEPN-like nuclease [Thiorhodovibrio frisius]|uniref:MAE-28990/MAE-18760-like HEPN domain-containing protein n=1 Tax=Thiorhodovibrio frisius TaxID=631362 RepID=H8YZ68_9GAMM|nr:MAE_28990/MAE_18760 family HEPN-like nuclease [Thiorhodovibrio frisius]EIC21995.1 hypothetical protein Thi970DRAFT_02235 [Thiorhodovibrio frisius]WPL24286.1 hypothetical protein Thiofri_04503 [Thiorhodovibrio frisius]